MTVERVVIDGKKPKFSAGQLGHPVRFKGAGKVTHIAEGPEDAATLALVTGQPAWAALGLNQIGKLRGTGLDIIVHADRGSETKAQAECEKLACFAGSVSLAPPPDGFKDVNEAFQAGDVASIEAAIKVKTHIPRPRPDGLPKGYNVLSDGALEYWQETAKDGSWIYLCSPLVVLALTRSGSDTEHGRHVEVIAPSGVAHRVSIPARSLGGDGNDIISDLLALGFTFHRKSRDKILQLLMDWTPKTLAKSASHLGWSDASYSTFVLGSGEVLGVTGSEPVVFQSEAMSTAALDLHSMGSLADWRSGVAVPSANNPVLVFALSLAFSGPLLAPTNTKGGGFNFMGGSSQGKTTALQAARSVWGGPDSLLTWRATSNGLEAIAACRNSTLLVLDELGEVESRDAGAVAYMLANGTGKVRAGRTGGLRKSHRWCEMFLSSGEISLSDKMSEGGHQVKAGQQVRMADITVTNRLHGVFDDLHGTPHPKRFADDLNAAAALDYGTAGPAFVEYILPRMDEVKGLIEARVQSFEAWVRKTYPKADAQVLRVASRFGLIAAAGEIATNAGITGWTKKEATSAIGAMFRVWMDDRGSAGSGEDMEAISKMRSFLSAHGDSRFSKLLPLARGGWHEDPDQNAIRDRAGWYQPPVEEGDDRSPAICWITSDAWKEITKGMNPLMAARTLRDAGLLITGGGKWLQRQLPRGLGARRAYAVSEAILSVDDAGEISP